MTIMQTKVYDTVRADTLEVGDRIEFAGYTCVIKAITDEGLMGFHVDMYNEDEDEDIEGEPFGASVMVNLVHDVWED